MSRFKDREFHEDLSSAARVNDISMEKLDAIADPDEQQAVKKAFYQMLMAFGVAGFPTPSLSLITAARIFADSMEQMAAEWEAKEADTDSDDNSAWSKRRAS